MFSFTTTSATVYVDTVVITIDLQRYGGWKSATLAQSYVKEFTEYKKKAAKRISKAIACSINVNSSDSVIIPTKKAKLTKFNKCLPTNYFLPFNQIFFLGVLVDILYAQYNKLAQLYLIYIYHRKLLQTKSFMKFRKITQKFN